VTRRATLVDIHFGLFNDEAGPYYLTEEEICKQRAEEDFRRHLWARFEEFLDGGLGRDDAMRRAVEETKIFMDYQEHRARLSRDDHRTLWMERQREIEARMSSSGLSREEVTATLKEEERVALELKWQPKIENLMRTCGLSRDRALAQMRRDYAFGMC
jgi:hypothetical protein